MRLKVKNILYDSQQVTEILLGERESSTFLEVLDNERPLDTLDNFKEMTSDSSLPLEDVIVKIEY